MQFLLCFALVCAVAIAKPMAEKSHESSIDVKNETVLNLNRVERNDDQQFPPVQTSAKSGEMEPKTELNTDLTTDANDKSRLSYASAIQINPSVYPPQLTSIHNTNPNYPARLTSDNYGSVVSSYPSYRSYDSLGSPTPVYSSFSPSGLYGLGQSGLSAGSPESCGSLITSVIPTSYSNAIPYRGGINIAQQIIHKPIITELQEVIHKPVITEIQEIVNKPIISEVQQVVHKPLYTEHIGLGPSYHGYQKHIVKQPIYENPTKNFVRQPIYYTEPIHLKDEYENYAVSTNTAIPSNCEPETVSSYGLAAGTSFPVAYGSGLGDIQPSALYSSAPSVPTCCSPLSSNSKPLYYARVPFAQTSNRYTGQTPIGYSNPTSLPSYRYTSGPSIGRPYGQQAAIFNTNYEESYTNIKGKTQPLIAEQIAYNNFVPYKQPLNNHNNQQYYDSQLQQSSGLQQSWGRNSEDSTQIQMDVDAIAKEIEKNPEMKRQLLKIITESMYIASNQITQTNKKQDKSINLLSPIKFD